MLPLLLRSYKNWKIARKGKFSQGIHYISDETTSFKDPNQWCFKGDARDIFSRTLFMSNSAIFEWPFCFGHGFFAFI